jgi:protein-disulfide isomerase
MAKPRHKGAVDRAPIAIDPATVDQARPMRGDRRAARQEAERRDARRRTVRRWAFPAILGAAGLAIVAILAFGALASPARPAVGAVRAVLGASAAPVVVREYGDFQCPSCGAWARSVEAPFRAAFIDTERVRLEWHDFPWIGPESRVAANAARCAGAQGKFWAYHDALYQNQGGENSGTFTLDRLKSLGMGIVAYGAAFAACIDHGTYADAVTADLSDATGHGFNSTPTFLVGTQRLVGPPTLQNLESAIRAAGG